jgi:hypothetical protein
MEDDKFDWGLYHVAESDEHKALVHALNTALREEMGEKLWKETQEIISMSLLYSELSGLAGPKTYKLVRPKNQKPLVSKEGKDFISFASIVLRDQKENTYVVYLKGIVPNHGPLYLNEKNFQLMQSVYSQFIDHYEIIETKSKYETKELNK